MINSKFEKDGDYSIDGFEDFNTEIFEKQKDINIKYSTIQIEKKIPILLSDEAFNRKMKEYQTENFRRKKELELNDEINNKMSKNGSKKSIKTNNKMMKMNIYRINQIRKIKIIMELIIV